MNTAEIKLKIFRQIDSVEPSKLEEIYGLILNYINSKKETNEWIGISKEEIKQIETALYELESGKGIPNSLVMEKYLNRYQND